MAGDKILQEELTTVTISLTWCVHIQIHEHAGKLTQDAHTHPSKFTHPPKLARSLLQMIALTHHFTYYASLCTSE